jgi:hypothetical protein
VTLNDPVYHEAAEALAERMLNRDIRIASGSVLEGRLNYGATCVLSRDLSREELSALETFYTKVRRMPSVSEGIAKARPSVVPPAANRDLAALSAVAGVLLNLDAALTR